TLFAFFVVLLMLPDKTLTSNRKTEKFSFKKLLRNKVARGLLLFRGISAMGRGGLMAFLPILASRINITSSLIGIIISVNIFVTALFQGAFGKLADRYNKVLLVLIGSTVSAVALFCMPFASNFFELLLIGLIMGLSGAISMPAATAITVKLGQRLGMGSAMGAFNTAMSIGMIIAPLISGVVMDAMGLDYVFYVAGIISIFGTVVFYNYLKGEFRNI
ncbi:MAG: MFS transporter, partial [Candidatus Diapherotrites archaeon]|nr:MFS transporter [Candidatus Diapherotrites archaeon]